MRNINEKLEDIVVKQIVDLTTFIKEIEEMIKKDKDLILVNKFLNMKVKQVIYLPDNTWVWYNWN